MFQYTASTHFFFAHSDKTSDHSSLIGCAKERNCLLANMKYTYSVARLSILEILIKKKPQKISSTSTIYRLLKNNRFLAKEEATANMTCPLKKMTLQRDRMHFHENVEGSRSQQAIVLVICARSQKFKRLNPYNSIFVQSPGSRLVCRVRFSIWLYKQPCIFHQPTVEIFTHLLSVCSSV
jgi:hypothetical protein